MKQKIINTILTILIFATAFAITVLVVRVWMQKVFGE
jgi:hypothetical protein